MSSLPFVQSTARLTEVEGNGVGWGRGERCRDRRALPSKYIGRNLDFNKNTGVV